MEMETITEIKTPMCDKLKHCQSSSDSTFSEEPIKESLRCRSPPPPPLPPAYISDISSCSNTLSPTTSSLKHEDETKLESEHNDDGDQKQYDEAKEEKIDIIDDKLSVYIYDKFNDKTIPIKTKKNIPIKSIIIHLMKHKICKLPNNINRKVQYFLVHNKTQKILNPSKSLHDYHVQNQSILTLRQKPPKSKIKSPQKPIKSGKKGKFAFMCSFGAPYINRKLKSSYHPDVSLDEYACKIKQKFEISQSTKITFSFNGKACLGKQRKCPVKELGINAGDIVNAATSGINITIKYFHCPEVIKLVEMFQNFTYEMLKDQIKLELGIPMTNIKAIIAKPWIIIDSDEKCKKLQNFSTITVLSKCNCIGCDENKTKEQQRPQKYRLQEIPRYYSYDIEPAGPAPIYISNDYQPDMDMNDMECPPYPDHYDGREYDNNNVYDDEYIGDMPGNNVCVDEFIGYPPQFNPYQHPPPPSPTDDIYIPRHLVMCRYGESCRYYRNPHISGPCRYYHPPLLEDSAYPP